MSFNYVKSISNPPAPDSQLGLNPLLRPWVTVNLDDGLDADDGIFSLQIIADFNPVAPAETTTPSITQVAFSINGFGALPSTNTFSFVPAPFCSPNQADPPETTCDGTFGLSYGLDTVGVEGAGAAGLNKKGFDLLVNLPPPGIKLDVIQSPITLFIQGPIGFSVESFSNACSNGATPNPGVGDCPAGSYATVAKIQELYQNGSTVIAGVVEDGQIPIETQGVPAPLPLLGIISALTFSRRLRHRQGAQRANAAGTVSS